MGDTMKYPKGITPSVKDTINYGNRGMDFESEINQTNQYYLENNIAVIHKKPTSITIAHVDYKSRREAIIKEAYFKTPSTTDYNGVFQGRYIDFEAKETNSLTSFPLSNIHLHQLNHLKQIINHGGIGFLLVRFRKRNETYYVDGHDLFSYLSHCERKSLPIAFFQKYGFLIADKWEPRVDYLEIVTHIYIKGELYGKEN